MSTFLLASCLFVTVSNNAMDTYPEQAKEALIAHPYISAGALAAGLVGSYFCCKYFFGRKPVATPDTQSKDALLKKPKKQTTSPINTENTEPPSPLCIECPYSPLAERPEHNQKKPKRHTIGIINQGTHSLKLTYSTENNGSIEEFIVPNDSSGFWEL